MAVVSCSSKDTQANEEESKNFTTVKRLAELNVERLPSKYILPPTERPNAQQICSEQYNLPVIDISGLEGPERAQVVRAIGRACQERGFFQVVNHGISTSIVNNMMEVASQFFHHIISSARFLHRTLARHPWTQILCTLIHINNLTNIAFFFLLLGGLHIIHYFGLLRRLLL